MNSRDIPTKMANLERVVNRAMLVVLGAQALLSSLSSILYVSTEYRFRTSWYLYPSGTWVTEGVASRFVANWFKFFISVFEFDAHFAVCNNGDLQLRTSILRKERPFECTTKSRRGMPVTVSKTAPCGLIAGVCRIVLRLFDQRTCATSWDKFPTSFQSHSCIGSRAPGGTGGPKAVRAKCSAGSCSETRG